MTVVQPNSIAGINSISVQSGNALNLHKSDGTLIRTLVAESGISTYSSISVGSATTDNNANKSINIGLGASIAQHADNTLSFGTNGDERARITSGGDINLHNRTSASTTDPITVDLGGQFTADASITHQNLKIKIYSNTANNDSGGLTAAQSGMAYVSPVTAGHLFYTAPSSIDTLVERMRIQPNGQIGIGTVPVESEGTELAIRSRDGQTNVGLIPNTNSQSSQLTFYNATNDSAQGYIKYDNSSNSLQVRVNLAERLRITSAGDVGISTVAPASKLHLYDAASDGLIVQSPSGLHYVWAIQSAGNLNNGSLAGELGIRAQSGVSISANNGTGTQLRLTSDGRLRLGASTDEDIHTGEGADLQVVSTDAGGLTFARDDTTVSNGANLGIIRAYGNDNDGTYQEVASIQFQADLNHGTGDKPGRLVFSTTSDGQSSVTERLRLNSSGGIGIAGANFGTSGQVLTSGGSGAAVSWATPSGGISIAQQWRLTSKLQANQDPLTGWELVDTQSGGGYGTSMSESSGIWTFPSTGWWLITFHLQAESDNHTQRNIADLRTTTNNSSYTTAASAMQGIYDYNNSYPSHGSCTAQHLFDVTDTSTHKVKLTFGAGQGGEYAHGDSSYTYTYGLFERLGDT